MLINNINNTEVEYTTSPIYFIKKGSKLFKGCGIKTRNHTKFVSVLDTKYPISVESEQMF